MKRNKTIIIVLLLVLIINCFLMYKSSNNRKITLDNVNLKEEIKNMKGIAIMLEQDDGTYKESDTNTFPIDMKYNEEKSGCIDNLGNKIANSLTYENGIANVTTSNTSYCYLYFDEATAVDKILANAGDDLWESTLEDDGYRYVGTDPANYVCFGYSDASTDCDFTDTTNSDLYAYRIIGIFEDSEGTQHLKLIKKEALNTSYEWDIRYSSNINWNESALYQGINGSYFLSNTTYSYMQGTKWINKIVDWEYIATNTLTTESSGVHYGTTTVQNIYLHEMNRSTKSSTVGEWQIVSAKIGIMYISDYLLSLGSSSLEKTGTNSTLKTGWMLLSNNDSSSPSGGEWTISQAGAGVDSYSDAWLLNVGGTATIYDATNTSSVRPVFYLTSDVTISGEGTSTNPYIIS